MSTQPAGLEKLSGAESAALDELGDASIEEVLSALDRPAPDARALYYRWERQQWEAGAIDFSIDAADWRELEPQARTSLLESLSCLSDRSDGGDRTEDLLVPFVDAVPTEDQQVFLTSQLADRARAGVFFERFASDAVGAGDPAEGLRGDGLVELLDMVAARAELVRHQRDASASLYEGIFLYNVLFQGVIAPIVHRDVDDLLTKLRRLPGLRAGLLALARDSTRHALFGVRLLQEKTAPSAGAPDDDFTEGIEALIEQAIPLIQGVVRGSGAAGDGTPEDPAGAPDPSATAMELLARRMQDIGIDLPT